VARSGRRGADSGTREAIEREARDQFATSGYDRTSMRAVAAGAGVDESLVRYFFRSKQELFVAAVGLPLDPQAVADDVFSEGTERAGARLAELFLRSIEQPGLRDRMTGLLRAAASEPAAADLVRDLIADRIVSTIVGRLDVADAELRAGLVGSQLLGLVLARSILGIEPFASAPISVVRDAVAPALQHYLTGSLTRP
jgi:AcrR family transcriptional regulator